MPDTNYDAGSKLGKEYAELYSKYRDAVNDSQPLSIILEFYYWVRLKMLDEKILRTYKSR